jgi:hypothetical protein
MAGTGIGLGETAIKHLNDLVGHIREGLRKERHEHGIPTRGRRPLEGLSARLARKLCQELEAVGMQRLQGPRVDSGVQPTSRDPGSSSFLVSTSISRVASRIVQSCAAVFIPMCSALGHGGHHRGAGASPAVGLTNYDEAPSGEPPGRDGREPRGRGPPGAPASAARAGDDISYTSGHCHTNRGHSVRVCGSPRG